MPATVQQASYAAVLADLKRRVRILEALNNMIPTVKDLSVDFNTSGDHTLISGVAGTIIQVTGGMLIAAGVVVVQFKDSTPLAKTGALPLIKATGFSNSGWTFKCASGKGLVLNMSLGIQVGGIINYRILQG